MVVPGVLGDQRAGHHPAGVPHQVLEDRVLLGRELDPLPRPAHFAGAGVQFEVGHAEDGRSHLLGPAAQRFDPRQQLVEAERLGDVIIGAGPERVDLEIH